MKKIPPCNKNHYSYTRGGQTLCRRYKGEFSTKVMDKLDKIINMLSTIRVAPPAPPRPPPPPPPPPPGGRSNWTGPAPKRKNSPKKPAAVNKRAQMMNNLKKAIAKRGIIG